jgi:uncharacterized membrane protein YgdD (TMEM256/DUF423 family)
MNRRADARGWIAAAAGGGAISVVGGAFAAHGLDPIGGGKAIGWLQTASLFGGLHALAMLAVAALAGLGRINDSAARVVQALFLLGSILFSGALYVLALGGPRWLGAVAPAGGIAFIAGWVSLAVSALRDGPGRRL